MTTSPPPSLPDEKWRPLFDRAGIEFGYRPLAARSGMNHTRVHRALRGGGTTTDAVETIAATLGTTADTIWRLRGDTDRIGQRPFEVPENAHLLTDSERRLVRDLINALVTAHNEPHPKTDGPADES